jgi:hypothetical protein
LPTNPTIFAPANRAITDDIKKELRLQGHYLTGALEASLLEKEISESGGVTLTASALEYLEDLENFTQPENIKLSRAGFEDLKGWVLLRGMTTSTSVAEKIAFAILRKWKKEGRPTAASTAFSKTGQRTKAVEIAFEKNESNYFEMIDDTVLATLDNIFHEVKSGTL